MLTKIKDVFTKEYQQEIQYRAFLVQSLSYFKLKTQSEDVDTNINRLRNREFRSQYS